MLYLLEPEVAGELGEGTSYKNFDDVRAKGERPIVETLHYHFTGWLGDELLEATPCFIVTEELALEIAKSNLSGCRLVDVIITLSDEFIDIYPNRILPKFKRLVPTGSVIVEKGNFREWTGEDICMSQDAYLVVSNKTLEILKTRKFTNCDITELDD